MVSEKGEVRGFLRVAVQAIAGKSQLGLAEKLSAAVGLFTTLLVCSRFGPVAELSPFKDGCLKARVSNCCILPLSFPLSGRGVFGAL